MTMKTNLTLSPELKQRAAVVRQSAQQTREIARHDTQTRSELGAALRAPSGQVRDADEAVAMIERIGQATIKRANFISGELPVGRDGAEQRAKLGGELSRILAMLDTAEPWLGAEIDRDMTWTSVATGCATGNQAADAILQADVLLPLDGILSGNPGYRAEFGKDAALQCGALVGARSLLEAEGKLATTPYPLPALSEIALQTLAETDAAGFIASARDIASGKAPLSDLLTGRPELEKHPSLVGLRPVAAFLREAARIVESEPNQSLATHPAFKAKAPQQCRDLADKLEGKAGRPLMLGKDIRVGDVGVYADPVGTWVQSLVTILQTAEDLPLSAAELYKQQLEKAYGKTGDFSRSVPIDRVKELFIRLEAMTKRLSEAEKALGPGWKVELYDGAFEKVGFPAEVCLDHDGLPEPRLRERRVQDGKFLQTERDRQYHLRFEGKLVADLFLTDVRIAALTPNRNQGPFDQWLRPSETGQPARLGALYAHVHAPGVPEIQAGLARLTKSFGLD